jgi:energy-converting hydrogenase Eha subunit A
LTGWFLIAGAVGIVVAAVITVLMIRDQIPLRLALALWPTSILALGDLGYQRTFIEKAITVAFTFGGEFMLYGVAGFSLGYGIHVVRTFISRQ